MSSCVQSDDEVDGLLRNLQIDGLSKVCEDSGSQDLRLPPLSKSIVLKLTKNFRLDQLISIVFLIIVPTQALDICRKLWNPNHVLSGEKVIEYLVDQLGKSASKGAHSVLFGALSLVGKLIPYIRELIAETEESKKKLELTQYISPDGYEALCEACKLQMDEARVKLFHVAIELTPTEAAKVVNSLKNKDPSISLTQTDANAWSSNSKICDSPMELMVLELLAEKNFDSEVLLKSLAPLILEVSQLSKEKLSSKFTGFFELDENAQSYRKLTNGECLIINNKNFARESEVRHGSEVDSERLSHIFESYNCTVSRKSDLTAYKLQETLKAFQKKVNEKGKQKDDGFFVVIAIMSHGRKVQNVDEIIGTDGVGISVNDIVDMLSDSKMCPGLIGKVKVFIFQACRLEEPVDPPKSVEESSQLAKDRSSGISADSIERQSTSKNSSPNKSWRIEFRSTSAGEPSYRDPQKGAFFIRAFCDIMAKEGSNPEPVDLVKIFTRANSEASKALEKASNGMHHQCGECTMSCMGEVFLPDFKQISQ